jgi:GETHR pentapeptide repeat (5 copies)
LLSTVLYTVQYTNTNIAWSKVCNCRKFRENVRGENVRGENVRGENVRGENVRGENVRGENVSVMKDSSKKSILGDAFGLKY